MFCTLCGRDHAGICDKPWPLTARTALAVVVGRTEFCWQAWNDLGCPNRLKVIMNGIERTADPTKAVTPRKRKRERQRSGRLFADTDAFDDR